MTIATKAKTGVSGGAIGAATGGGDHLQDPLASGATPRTVAGGGGYTYQQFPDGTLVIVSGPSGAGARLTNGSAWSAITQEIGPYPGQVAPPKKSTTPTEKPAKKSTTDDGGSSSGGDDDVGFLDWLADEADSFTEAVEEWGDNVVGGATEALSTAWNWFSGGEEEQPAPATERKKAKSGPKIVPAPEGTTREDMLTDYNTWLAARLGEVEALSGNDKVSRVDGLLQQVEDVSSKINSGVIVDISKLNTRPSGQGTPKENGYVPPELIGTVRSLIQVVERDVDGATRSDDAAVEGSQYSGTDWNSRLGVPTYRNQLDNLVAGEATCNVTSTAMVYERLGMSRADVFAAVETEIKKKVLKAQGLPATDQAVSDMELSDDQWKSEVEKYLKKINDDSKNYRKVRGVSTTTAQREDLAEEYADNAQMEDLLDFLVHLSGEQSRYQIVGDPTKLLKKVQPNAEDRPTTEQLWKWNSASIEKLTACMNGGGAAILSLFHKGSGSTGSHLVSVQSVSGDKVIVDDPYGMWRSDYLRDGTTRDAYTKSGKSRSASGLRNQTHTGDMEDWKSSAAQDLDANESRGDSAELSSTQVKQAFNRLTLYYRA